MKEFIFIIGLALISISASQPIDSDKEKECICHHAKNGEYPKDQAEHKSYLDTSFYWEESDENLKKMCKVKKLIRPGKVDKKKKKEKKGEEAKPEAKVKPEKKAEKTKEKKEKKKKGGKAEPEPATDVVTDPPVTDPPVTDPPVTDTEPPIFNTDPSLPSTTCAPSTSAPDTSNPHQSQETPIDHDPLSVIVPSYSSHVNGNPFSYVYYGRPDINYNNGHKHHPYYNNYHDLEREYYETDVYLYH